MRCFDHLLGNHNKDMKNILNTTALPSFFLGIDVGKKDLFCHIISPFETFSARFDNTTKGIKQLITWMKKTADPQHLSACLEQTGHYGKAVARALYKMNIIDVYLVNPRRIKAYGDQQLRRNKSDTADAKLIAEFLESKPKKLIAWEPPSIDNEKVTELSRYADSITRDNAKLKTKCEAATNSIVLRSLKRRIKTQEKEIQSIRKEINKVIGKNANLKMWDELLRSIPGVGEVGSHVVIAELPDLALFKDARQLAAWAGVTPQHHQSGTSGRKSTPITKVGSIHLRRGLYMPARTAKTHNPLLKTFADRLEEKGKSSKQITVAVMRKLLHQIYGILKSGEPYNPEKRGFLNHSKPLTHIAK
jgi:transposase